jgi:predicted transcriptional regulator
MREDVRVRRDEDAVARFVERFAVLLTEAGMPRMPSRVFARLLVIDDGKATAAELAGSLHVSPAAISGAVRYLDQVHLAHRSRDPGERRDHYEVTDDLWYEVFADRDKLFEVWAGLMADGVAAVGEDSPAGHRLDQSRRLFEFLRKELPLVMEKWRAQEGR